MQFQLGQTYRLIYQNDVGWWVRQGWVFDHPDLTDQLIRAIASSKAGITRDYPGCEQRLETFNLDTRKWETIPDNSQYSLFSED